MSAFTNNGGEYPIGIQGAPTGYAFPEPSDPSANPPPGYPAQRPLGFSPACSVELPSYSSPTSPLHVPSLTPSYSYPQTVFEF